MDQGRDTSGVDSLLSQAILIELLENPAAGSRGRGRGRGRGLSISRGRGRGFVPVDQNGIHLNFSGGRGRGIAAATSAVSGVVTSGGRGRGLIPVDQNGMQFNLCGGRGRSTHTAISAVSDSVVLNVNSYVLPRELVDFHARLQDSNMDCPVPIISKHDSAKKAQCPVLNNIICLKCQNICALPFMSCPDGHLFCNDCIKGLEKCHICEHKEITSRQLGLEGIVMAMEWPCEFSEKGCKSVLKMDMIKEHAAICRYKTHQKCIVDECKEYVPSEKNAFAKHLKDCHNCKILKVPFSCNSKRVVFKTCFKVTDYVKDNTDCKKVFETVNVLETDDNFFFFKIMESMNTFTFQCYTIGDSLESECGFYCSRVFKQTGISFAHMICEPIISITEKSLGKRKMEEYEPIFSLDKKKAHVLYKSTGNDSKKTVECTMKIGHY